MNTPLAPAPVPSSASLPGAPPAAKARSANGRGRRVLPAWFAFWALVVSSAQPQQALSTPDGPAEIAKRLMSAELARPDAELFKNAPLDALRRILDASTRPFGEAGRQAAESILTRPDALAFRLGTEYIARLPPQDAATRLLELRSDPRSEALQWLPVFGPIAEFDSAPTLLPMLGAHSAAERASARTAISTLRDHLLAEARAEDAATLLAAAVAEDSGASDLLRSLRVVSGVYLRQGLAALPPPTPPLAASGPLALETAEDDVVAAMIRFFVGFGAEADTAERAELPHALDTLDRAAARLSNVGVGARHTALTVMRVQMVRAIAEIASHPPLAPEADDPVLARAAELLRVGLQRTPRDPYYFVPDDAMYGAAGPFSWLDTLRRRGRPDVRHTFYRALTAAERAEHPAENESNDSSLDDPHSFAMLWHGYANLVDGRPERAIELSTQLGKRLERAALWRDQWLVGESLVLRGTAKMHAGDLKGARGDLEAAIRKLEELDLLERQSAFESKRELRAHAVPGVAEVDRTLASILSVANHTLAEVLSASGEAERARATIRLAVVLDPFSDAAVAFMLALDPDTKNSLLSQRFLVQAPRRADSLLDLARLAYARGDLESSRSLFATHLEWNALTQERRDLELERAKLDPFLEP